MFLIEGGEVGKMNEELKTILNKAIAEEDYFVRLYSEAANQAEAESAKRIFLRLSEEERLHKIKLEELDVSGLQLGAHFLGSSLKKLTEELMLTPITEFRGLKDVISFAISSEIRAKDMYTNLAESIDTETAAQLFRFLATEEGKHEALLRKTLETLNI